MNELLLHNTDQVIKVILWMREGPIIYSEGDEVISEVSSIISGYQGRYSAGQPSRYTFARISALVMKLIKSTIDLQKFAQMLVDKHKLYGARPLIKWGSTGIMIRIDSKFERYLNLKKETAIRGDTPTMNESIDDTLQDIIGYCVLGYLMEKA